MVAQGSRGSLGDLHPAGHCLSPQGTSLSSQLTGHTWSLGSNQPTGRPESLCVNPGGDRTGVLPEGSQLCPWCPRAGAGREEVGLLPACATAFRSESQSRAPVCTQRPLSRTDTSQGPSLAVLEDARPARAPVCKAAFSCRARPGWEQEPEQRGDRTSQHSSPGPTWLQIRGEQLVRGHLSCFLKAQDAQCHRQGRRPCASPAQNAGLWGWGGPGRS